ncbi:Hypothetical protein LOCK908_1246 [Lacticaseibacillus rhamnosus LOCK908]|uniref:Uncharacterized protein n=1 Tax=Lacticaseibacillus rhamnosus (strain LMS2-1) TaxID=525361 RepID=C2JWG3_LACRM|nr:hypothetical protein LRHK_1188 [Lacticaseibacillus rhamnosus ATCC 8530]AGP73885.1 Hypothetical protein LOCK908_1246 [Lacticaseibacillus rhamnosus LOCK908]EEN80613.1 hypothetical protein HMPREF0539_1247 [Lacticaseibacillus rhamnosus LMS2-1]
MAKARPSRPRPPYTPVPNRAGSRLLYFLLDNDYFYRLESI